MEEFGAPTGYGLRIHTPTAEYLFAMKCMAMRPPGAEGHKDIADIEALVRVIGIKDVDEALSLIEAFYPKNQIPPKVAFGVQEIMERLSKPGQNDSEESPSTPSHKPSGPSSP